jgi:hypothetical protein
MRINGRGRAEAGFLHYLEPVIRFVRFFLDQGDFWRRNQGEIWPDTLIDSSLRQTFPRESTGYLQSRTAPRTEAFERA